MIFRTGQAASCLTAFLPRLVGREKRRPVETLADAGELHRVPHDEVAARTPPAEGGGCDLASVPAEAGVARREGLLLAVRLAPLHVVDHGDGRERRMQGVEGRPQPRGERLRADPVEERDELLVDALGNSGEFWGGTLERVEI